MNAGKTSAIPVKLAAGQLILVTGGARSGKSTFAEQLAAREGNHIAYIATAQVFDEEMDFRVRLHQSRRPDSWQTYEAPFDAHEAIRTAAQEHDLILFDCITIYLSNLLCTLPESALDDQDRNHCRPQPGNHRAPQHHAVQPGTEHAVLHRTAGDS